MGRALAQGLQVGRSMKIAKLIRVLVGGFVLSAAVLSWAEDEGEQGDFDLEAVVQELDLSDEQLEKVRVIMEDSKEARRSILEEHGIEFGKGVRPDRREMRAAMPELRAARKATEERLAEVLDEEQMAKYKELRKAMGKKVGKKLKERRQVM